MAVQGDHPLEHIASIMAFRFLLAKLLFFSLQTFGVGNPVLTELNHQNSENSTIMFSHIQFMTPTVNPAYLEHQPTESRRSIGKG